MPILMWIAFWSSTLGVAAGWQETFSPIRVWVADRRDRPAELPPASHPHQRLPQLDRLPKAS